MCYINDQGYIFWPSHFDKLNNREEFKGGLNKNPQKHKKNPDNSAESKNSMWEKGEESKWQ